MFSIEEKGDFQLKQVYFQVNPFMRNVFSHLYQMDESIANLRVVGSDFSFLFKF